MGSGRISSRRCSESSWASAARTALLVGGDAAHGAAHGDSNELFEPEHAETVAKIKELIETRVRPAVANDGGDIVFRGFKDGVVYLKMKGACSGCRPPPRR